MDLSKGKNNLNQIFNKNIAAMSRKVFSSGRYIRREKEDGFQPSNPILFANWFCGECHCKSTELLIHGKGMYSHNRILSLENIVRSMNFF